MTVHQGRAFVEETRAPLFSSLPSSSSLVSEEASESSSVTDSGEFALSPPEWKDTSFLILLSAGIGGLVN